MMTRKKARIFLVDDHEVVRQGVRTLLESSGTAEVVGEASTAGDALRLIAELVPDVVVLDSLLPDGSGVEVCRAVRSTHAETQVLFLTSFADDEAMMAAVLAGAAGYLLKDVRLDGLVDAILRVAAGESLIEPGMQLRLAERIGEASHNSRELIRLTRQERRILLLIAEGLTNRQIAEKVSLSEGTVKNYVSSILGKLGLERRAQAAVYAAQLPGQSGDE